MVTSDAPDLAIRSFHRPAVDSSGTLLPSDRVDGATTIGPANVRRQIASFATIGLVSTIAYLLLYAAFRAVLGPTVSNALALVLTSIANTGLNRRLTFGIRGRDRLAYDHAAGLVMFAMTLGLTTAAISLLGVVAPSAGRLVELAVLLGSNAVATAVRFLVLRSLIGRPAFGAR